MSVKKVGSGGSWPKKDRVRINANIKAEKVRLIDADANMIGIVSLREALNLAKDANMDLVEVAQDTDNPVCKILNYGKFKYNEQKRVNQIKKKQKSIIIKEVKFRLVIETGDRIVKLRRIESFISQGFKVKVMIRLKGREIANKQVGLGFMHEVAEELSEVACLDGKISTEGSSVLMLLAPKVGK